MFLNVWNGKVSLIDRCCRVCSVKAESITEVRQNINLIHKLLFDAKTLKQQDYLKQFFSKELSKC